MYVDQLFMEFPDLKQYLTPQEVGRLVALGILKGDKKRKTSTVNVNDFKDLFQKIKENRPNGRLK